MSKVKFQWFTVVGVYYGLTFGSTSILGDPYSNYALGGVFDIMASLVSYYTLDRVGRKWTMILCQGSAGVACIVTGLINSSPELATLQTGQ